MELTNPDMFKPFVNKGISHSAKGTTRSKRVMSTTDTDADKRVWVSWAEAEANEGFDCLVAQVEATQL